jgi:flavin reductase (DIM6/NTAB) family NADH-FMN oxidoreductase RutF
VSDPRSRRIWIESGGTPSIYSILTSIVVPRPIAWVSTRSVDGIDNLAQHSFYTVACVDPPIVQFTSVGRKDSLRNVEKTHEFVVNFAPEPLFEQINATERTFRSSRASSTRWASPWSQRKLLRRTGLQTPPLPSNANCTAR